MKIKNYQKVIAMIAFGLPVVIWAVHTLSWLCAAYAAKSDEWYSIVFTTRTLIAYMTLLAIPFSVLAFLILLGSGKKPVNPARNSSRGRQIPLKKR